MLQRRTKATVGLLSLVLVTVGLVELAQAVQSSAPRFVVLPPDQLGAALVLDTTTSLRWQKTPGSEPVSWLTASSHCASLGGGSRLPEIKELISLVDYSKFNPALPEGHPFQAVQAALFWSATAYAGNSANAWGVFFDSGDVTSGANKSNGNRVWCVR